MPISRMVLGNLKETSHPDTLKAAVAEFISMLIFVFAAEGSVISSKLASGGAATQAGLIYEAIAHAFALFVAVSLGGDLTAGHVNPAVTFGAFVGGHTTFCRSVLYWIAQLLGSVAACFLLKFANNGLETSAFALSVGVSPGHTVVYEIMITFALVYTVYATTLNPKRSYLKIIAPIAIAFIVGSNILAAGAFNGASMNPAMSFGPSVVSWTWNSHWVYWLGPFVGAAVAALIHETIFSGQNIEDQLPAVDNQGYQLLV